MSKNKMDRAAELAHDVWAAWMKYMFDQGYFVTENVAIRGQMVNERRWIMPQDKVARWTRQMNTPFWELPESERASDYSIAERFMEVFNEPS